MPGHEESLRLSGIEKDEYIRITQDAMKKGLIDTRDKKHFPAQMIGKREFLEAMNKSGWGFE